MHRRPLDTGSRLVSAVKVIVGGHIVAAGLATYWGQDGWYRKYLMPALRCVTDGETAHVLAVNAAKHGLMPRLKLLDHPEMKTQVWGLSFPSAIGLAAGFDKNGEAVDGLLKLGFGFVEVGSVTPQPQEGNPKPRVFRLGEDKAVINRYGFNSDGHEAVLKRLKEREKDKFASGLLGVNLGKNKTTVDAAGDYVVGVKSFASVADYLVINISSPNTPGLRALQNKKELEQLLEKVLKARDELPGKRPPLLLKLSPDLSPEDKVDIAAVIGQPKFRVDGLIISNTTVSRPSSLKSGSKGETGGLSGEPLRALALSTTRDMYRLTQGKVPIIGVGGISSGQDAYSLVRSGASLIQIYTVLVYDGPPSVKKISDELVQLLRKDGYQSISEAVGIGVKL